MHSTTGWSKAVKGIGVLIGVAGCLSWGQFNSSGQIGRQPGFGQSPSEIDSTLAAKRVRMLNADRHKALVSDTEKLVNLARQLDADIASNPTGKLTPEELHKVAAIEKLAHNVKTKMAQSFGEGPEIKPPIVPMGEPGVR